VPRRVELANGLGADLLVSLHCDLTGPLARGGFVAIVRGSGTGPVEFEALSLVPSGSATRDEVLTLARWESVGAEHTFAAAQLARSVADHLATAFPDAQGRVLTRPVWNLEGAHMPAVLIELGSLDRNASADPGELMSRGTFLNAAVDAIAAGIEDALSPELGASGEVSGGGLQGEKF
jgi:N-acetylmuramoyl-L-alanine amidase